MRRSSLLDHESAERRAQISFASFDRVISKTSDVPSSGPPRSTKPSAWSAFIKAAWVGQSSCCSRGSEGFHATVPDNAEATLGPQRETGGVFRDRGALQGPNAMHLGRFNERL